MRILFLGVAVFTVVPDNAHDMSLPTLLVYGVAHCLSVNSKSFVIALQFILSSDGTVEISRIDTDKHITNNKFAGNNAASVFIAAAKTLSRLLPKAFGPIMYCFVPAHTTQCRSSSNGKHNGKAMS